MIPTFPTPGRCACMISRRSSVPLTKDTLKKYDCVVIATDHSCYDYELIVKNCIAGRRYPQCSEWLPQAGDRGKGMMRS